MPDKPRKSPKAPSWGTRLAALFYDFLLTISVLVIGTLIYVMGSHYITSSEEVSPGDPVLRIYLAAILYLFFVGFWMHDGATLGMRAWKLNIVNSDGHRPSLRQASIRFFLAIISWLAAGGGFLWALFDPERRTFHDRFAGTWLIQRDEE
ncbi:Predicted transmembrane protein [Halorhodospira halochloris]|uniref:Predicted transmembrane protein n=1 Tax=Halorhodospira halochloris TaxID=1052 RepID=A0A0X8X7V2_HALHR|nr:RDD family protein [Halorhodospira halochloris]MBK1651556.1 hypothetical protein [Halorhodospira halochloris]MCG5548767.1 RDD family protein [Halorhodospira halochloris]BAU57179.2 Predicted transmembrane protein [Halorhodospira halochloris]